MVRGWLVWVVGVSACGSSRVPDCDEVSFADLAVESGPEGPVFRWTGSAPEYLDVYPGALPAEPSVFGEVQVSNEDRLGRAWALLCQCQEGECGDGTGCLPSPITYGVAPETDVFVSSDQGPAPLVAGETYTVVIGAWCEGAAVTDPNTGEEGHVGAQERWTSFVAD
jgi:hypothetical protein